MPNPSAQSLYKRSQVKFLYGHFQECLTLLNQAIDLDKSNTAYYSMRGETYFQLEEYERAIEDFQHAVELNPHDFFARINCGFVFVTIHDWHKALKLYEEAIAVSPDTALGHYSHASVLERIDCLPEACASYTRALELLPQFAAAYLGRGHILSRMGRHEEALVDYQQAYAVGSEDIEAAWIYAWSRFGKHPIGSEEAERLLQIASLPPAEHHYVSFVCHAVVALQQGDVPTALTHLERASTMFTDQWDTPFWTGMALAMQGKAEEAREAIDRAIYLGMPPVLLTPLYWLKEQQPKLFESLVRVLLNHQGGETHVET